MKWFVVVLLVLVAWPTAVFAQLPNLAELAIQYVPEAQMSEPAGVGTQLATYDVALNVPFVLSEKTFLVPGLSYHVDSVSFSDTPPDFVQLRGFHSLDASLLAVRLLPKRWAVSGRVAVGLAGDFARVDSRMLRTNVVLLGTKGFSDHLVLGGGAIASWAFGALLPLPAIYLDWTPAPWMQLETFIPAFAHWKAKPGTRLEFGLRADVAGNSYAVRDARVLHGPGCTPANSLQTCTDHVAYSIGTAGATIAIRLFHSVWVESYGGHSFFRRFEMMNREGDRVEGGLQSLPDRWFVRVSAVWRIPMDD